MGNEVVLDKLNRTYMMEEEMAGELIDLCRPDSLPEDLPEGARKRILGILVSIKNDTLRHKAAVTDAIKRLK